MALCRMCQKELGNGGVVREDKSIICFDCDQKLHNPRQQPISPQAVNVVSGKNVASDREQVAWLLFAFSLVLAILFGILWHRGSSRVVTKTIEVPKKIETIRTVEVIREIPKESVRVIKIPNTEAAAMEAEVGKYKAANEKLLVSCQENTEALENTKQLYEELSSKYIESKKLLDQYQSPEILYTEAAALKGHPDFRVTVSLSAGASRVLDQREIQVRMELRLRSLGIPIHDESSNTLSLSIDAMRTEEMLYVTVTELEFLRPVVFLRGNLPAQKTAPIWRKSDYGLAGSAIAKEHLEKMVDSEIGEFSNSYLRANPKE